MVRAAWSTAGLCLSLAAAPGVQPPAGFHASASCNRAIQGVRSPSVLTRPLRPAAGQSGGSAARSSPPAASRRPAAPDLDVPPVSMTCPMHPDVIESAPGSCPICRMTLVPVRLEAVWTCPRHPQIARHEAGACPIDHRALIQMTVALSWTCPDHPEIDRIDRGVCPDGTPMVPKRTLRPHGNHNPQHGGQFFMAPDNFHHLEGAYPRPRLFRLYLYDDYARPLPAAQLKQVKARVVTSEVYDSRAGTTRELASFPLAARSGVLQATIDRLPLPARMSAKVRFKDDGPEYRFDFTFAAYTQEPAPAAGTLVKASG